MSDTPQKSVDETGGERGDDLTALFGRVPARERPRESAEAGAFAALHSQWQDVTKARRHRRAAAFVAAAAASVTVAAIGYAWLQSSAPSAPVTLATIERVEGADVTWRDDRSQAQSLGARRNLEQGQRLATGSGSRVALRWHDGGSLRLDASSRVEFVSPAAVRLTAGSLYFDSAFGNDPNDSSAPTLAVQTPAGQVVHIGTQFMVTVDSDEVVLAVREGQVRVTGDGFEIVVIANEELDLRADGARSVAAIDGFEQRWAWAAEIAPLAELDGRTAFDIAAWAARETGRRVVYETSAVEAQARSNVVRGVERRTPAGMLTLLPYLTELAYEIRGDAIVVSEP